MLTSNSEASHASWAGLCGRWLSYRVLPRHPAIYVGGFLVVQLEHIRATFSGTGAVGVLPKRGFSTLGALLLLSLQPASLLVSWSWPFGLCWSWLWASGACSPGSLSGSSTLLESRHLPSWRPHTEFAIFKTARASGNAWRRVDLRHNQPGSQLHQTAFLMSRSLPV